MTSKQVWFWYVYILTIMMTIIDKPEEWVKILCAAIMFPIIIYGGFFLLGFVLGWTDN